MTTTKAGQALIERVFSAPFARTSLADDVVAIETEARNEIARALQDLAADLVNDHRGIPYDVIERIDKIAASIEDPQP